MRSSVLFDSGRMRTMMAKVLIFEGSITIFNYSKLDLYRTGVIEMADV